jgi:hypothetical protein
VANPIDRKKLYQNIILRNKRKKRKLTSIMIAENEIIFLFFLKNLSKKYPKKIVNINMLLETS